MVHLEEKKSILNILAILLSVEETLNIVSVFIEYNYLSALQFDSAYQLGSQISKIDYCLSI